MADDALHVNRMNVFPGGKQRILRDTSYNGKEQRMYTGQKVAKGLKRVLEERGISTDGRNKEWMQSVLSQHIDFKFEKCENVDTQRPYTHIPAKVSPRIKSY